MSLFRISRDFTTRQRLRSKIAMIFMLVTMGYILAFPTIASAMTGYNGNVAAFVPDNSGNFVKFESFQPVLYVIHDGDRINKTKDSAVTAFASGHCMCSGKTKENSSLQTIVQPYLAPQSINGMDHLIDVADLLLALADDAAAYYFARNVSLCMS
jgi:hypothetical protein